MGNKINGVHYRKSEVDGVNALLPTLRLTLSMADYK